MIIKWWGHACFQITSANGKIILTDPYIASIGYQKITVEPDIITVSHDHFDHNAVHEVPGNPVVIKTPRTHQLDEVTIQGVESYHDNVHGKKRGKNTIFIVEIDGMRIAHLGDLGEPLSSTQCDKIGSLDILLTPVGGNYTIDASQAYEVAKTLNPKIIIPMHYKTSVLDFPIDPVSKFTELYPSDQVKTTSEEAKIIAIPDKPTVYIMQFVTQT